MFDKKKYMEKYRLENKDKAKVYNHQWLIANPKYKEQWYLDNPEYNKQYRLDNKDKVKVLNHQYHLNNKDKRNAYSQQWHIANLQYLKQLYVGNKKERNEYYKNRYKTDIQFKLNNRMSTMIWHSLKGNKKRRHWEGLVNYALEDLMKHLKKTMPKGYEWQDFIDGKLEIDHIIPKSAFNFAKPEHDNFKRCWALSNLRLLSAKENRIKHNKLYKPFQLSFSI